MPIQTKSINHIGISTAERTKGGKSDVVRHPVVGLVADYLVRDLGFQNSVK